MRAGLKAVVFCTSPGGLPNLSASGSEGPQVAFAVTGFGGSQGVPLFNNDWCHLVRVGFKPFSGLVGLPGEVFPSIKGAWKRFLKRSCKFLHLTLFTGFAGVNERPSLLFCAKQFLCLHFYSAADEEVVRMAISTLIMNLVVRGYKYACRMGVLYS